MMEEVKKKKMSTKALLAKLNKDEVVDGNPTCNGLRRLVETYESPIRTVNVAVPHFVTQGSPQPTAVAVVTIGLEDGRHYSDVADCGMYNTDPPYDLFPSATAATRAEARVYRKVLNMKVVAYEEIAKKDDQVTLDDDIETDDIEEYEAFISDTQAKTIAILCKRANTTVDEFLSSNNYPPINTLSTNGASMAIEELNKIIQQK